MKCLHLFIYLFLYLFTGKKKSLTFGLSFPFLSESSPVMSEQSHGGFRSLFQKRFFILALTPLNDQKLSVIGIYRDQFHLANSLCACEYLCAYIAVYVFVHSCCCYVFICVQRPSKGLCSDLSIWLSENSWHSQSLRLYLVWIICAVHLLVINILCNGVWLCITSILSGQYNILCVCVCVCVCVCLSNPRSHNCLDLQR